MLSKEPAQKVSIYLNEDTRRHLVPLYKAVLTYLRHKGVSGATALSGFAGFGAHRVIHTAQIELLSDHLPVLIEFLESRARVEEVLPTLEDMVTDGLITVQNVAVLKHASQQMGRASDPRPAQISSKAKLLRAIVGEHDQWRGLPLYDAIVRRLYTMGISGATVYRGISGYGARALTPRSGRAVPHDIPMVVSVVDSDDKINLGAEAIEEMAEDAIIVVSDVDYTRLIQGQHQGATNHAKLPIG